MSRPGYVNYPVYRAERRAWFDILARRLGLPMPQTHAEFVRLMDAALQYAVLHSGTENQIQEKEKGENKNG